MGSPAKKDCLSQEGDSCQGYVLALRIEGSSNSSACLLHFRGIEGGWGGLERCGGKLGSKLVPADLSGEEEMGTFYIGTSDST